MEARTGRRERERESRREDILATAERVFLQKGFEASSMDEVAKEAEFTKRTVYQYFDSKEDLLFEIASRMLERFHLILEVDPTEEAVAFVRLKSYARRFYSVIRDHPAEAALMDDALALRSALRRRKDEPGPGFRVLERSLAGLYGSFVSTLAEGSSDGSLRNDLNPEGAAFSLFFLLKGFLGFVADGESRVVTSNGMGGDDLALYTLDLVVEGLRPTSS